MTKLDDAVRGVQRLGTDTAPVVYLIEANPRYDALVTEIRVLVLDELES